MKCQDHVSEVEPSHETEGMTRVGFSLMTREDCIQAEILENYHLLH
jgi:hypothetical protein